MTTALTYPSERLKELFHESNLIEGYDSEEADQMMFEAWQWLVNELQSKPLSNEIIKQLQAKIVAHQTDLKDDWVGDYRHIPVYIGGKSLPNPASVPWLMDNWLENRRKYPAAWKRSHIDFEHIHPFVDGNGRTGRLLMWLDQLEDGLEPEDITYADRRDYYAWF